MSYTNRKNKPSNLPLGSINYVLLVLGVLMIALGFVLMALDQATYGFGVLGLTIGPITVLAGFAIEFLAILYDRKKS